MSSDIKSSFARAKAWFNRRAANLSGVIYIGSNILLGVTGYFGLTEGLETSIGGGSTLIAADLTLAKYGHKDIGFNIGTSLVMAGFTMATWERLMNLQTGAIIAVAGVGMTVPIAWGSKYLERKFKNCANALTRNTLGHPRRIISALLTSTNVPLVVDAIINFNPWWLSVVTLWNIADGIIFFSKTEKSQAETEMKAQQFSSSQQKKPIAFAP